MNGRFRSVYEMSRVPLVDKQRVIGRELYVAAKLLGMTNVYVSIDNKVSGFDQEGYFVTDAYVYVKYVPLM